MSDYNKLKEYSFYQNDRDVVLEEVSKNGMNLEYASEELKKDKKIIFAAVSNNPNAIEFVDKKWRNNEDLFRLVLPFNGLLLEHAPNKIKDNRELCLIAVQNNGLSLQFVSKPLQDDKEVVLTALIDNGHAIRYASSRLKDDIETCLVAINNNATSLEHMSSNIKDNKEIVLTSLYKTGKALEYVSERLKKDREIVLRAVTKDGLSIRYVPENLKLDDEIANAALKEDIYALEYLPNYNNDFYKMSSLILSKKDFNMLNFIGEDLHNNKEFALICVSLRADSIKYFSNDIQNDKQVLWIAINNDCVAYEYASLELKKDPQLITLALEIEYKLRKLYKNQFNEQYDRADSILMYADESLRSDREIVKKAVESSFLALEFASIEIRNDVDFVLPIIDKNVDALQFAGTTIIDNEDIMKKYCLKYPASLRVTSASNFLSERLKNNQEFITDLINEREGNIIILKDCGPNIIDNKDFMLSIIQNSPDAFLYASNNLRNDIEVLHHTIKNKDKIALRLYEIQDKLGDILRKEVGTTPLNEYCDKAICVNNLEKKLADKTLSERKLKL